MITRKPRHRNTPSVSLKVQNARDSLAAKGWTYRAAAPALGVCFTHLALVLTGRRESRRLLAAIEALPPRAQEQDRAA